MSDSSLNESTSNPNIREVLEGMRTLALEVNELRRQNVSMRQLLDKSNHSGSFLSKLRGDRDNTESQKRILELENEVGRIKQEIVSTEKRYNDLNSKSKKQASEVTTLKQQLAEQEDKANKLEEKLQLEVDENLQLKMKICVQKEKIDAAMQQNTVTEQNLQKEINSLKDSKVF